MTAISRPGPTARVDVHEYVGDAVRRHEDRVVAEEPLELRLGWPGTPPHRVWVTMRTPGHDFELAAGWMIHEGVAAASTIHSIAYCTEEDLTPAQEFNVVTVTLSAPPDHQPAGRAQTHASGSSACGVCGKESIEAVLSTPRATAWRGATIGAETAVLLPERLRREQQVFATTGGVHAAGLSDATGRLLVVREDVGRHNALDKVTGARVLAGVSPAEAALVVSGRAGFELVQKAVAVGVGALVAVGAPTSLSVALAGEAGLALYGFTTQDRTVRYA